MNSFVHDMSVDLRSFDVAVTHELLNNTNIHPVFKEVGCKGVSERMWGCGFDDPALLYRSFDRFL